MIYIENSGLRFSLPQNKKKTSFTLNESPPTEAMDQVLQRIGMSRLQRARSLYTVCAHSGKKNGVLARGVEKHRSWLIDTEHLLGGKGGAEFMQFAAKRLVFCCFRILVELV